jgi:hypothetical protein
MRRSEIEKLVFEKGGGSRDEQLLERVLESLALNSSGIQTRKFAEGQFWVSNDRERPFVCAAGLSMKHGFLLAIGLTAAVVAFWAKERKGWPWDWQTIMDWFSGSTEGDILDLR